MNRKRWRGAGIGLGLLGLGLATAFAVGRYPVAPFDVARVIWWRINHVPSGVTPAVEAVVLNIRGPRVLAAVLIGSALASAGAAFQGLFRNPLVSPDILGSSSGAALGAVVGILLSLDVFGIQALSFIGGIAAVALVYSIGGIMRGGDAILGLVLTGVVVGSLLGAGVGLVKYMADPYNQLPAMTFWLLGSLAGISAGDLPSLLVPILLGTVVLLALRWRMNAMSLPEDEARSLGLSTGWLRLAIVTAANSCHGCERLRVRHHRLGRPRGAPSGAVPGRAEFSATAADVCSPRRLLSSFHRHARSLCRAGRDPAWHLDRRYRDTCLSRTSDSIAENVVMILEARELAIGYGRRVIGSDLNLTLAPGRMLALLGPNGGGKTTLLKTMLGLLAPMSGEVLLEGVPIHDWPLRHRAHRLAYVPQVHTGTFGFAVEDVVMMGRSAHTSLMAAPTSHDRRRVSEAMEVLGLGALGHRPYTEISGGERQLVLLARALAQEPKAIILDEPTASLDFANQGKVLRTLQSLAASGYGVLFTTHDPNHALRHADHVVMIRDGHILCQGETMETVTRERLTTLYRADVEEIVSDGRRLFLPT